MVRASLRHVLAPLALMATLSHGGAAQADEEARAPNPAPASGGPSVLGVPLVVGGSALTIAGGVMMVVGLGKSSAVSDACMPGAECADPSSGGTALLVAGVITGAIGLAATVTGAVLLARPSEPEAAPPAATAVRLPVWSATAPQRFAGAWAVPVFGASF